MSTRRVQAFLFDLDDTLYHRESFFRPWATWFVSDWLGRDDPAEQATVVETMIALDDRGYGAKPDLFDWLRDRYPAIRESPGELLAVYYQSRQRFMRLSDDAVRILDALRERDIPFGIVTNGPPEQQDKITTLGLDQRTACICISAIVGVNKPDPRIFQTALDLLGVTPEDTLFVGDNPANDIGGAKGVGMRTAWLRHGRDWLESAGAPPDLAIGSLDQLLPLVAKR